MPDYLPHPTLPDSQHLRAQSVGWLWLLCVILFYYGPLAATPSPAVDTNSPVGQAVNHYERARELLLALAAKVDKTKLKAERIGLDFDLATALSSDGKYGYRYARWGRPFWWWWGEGLEAEEDSEAVEEADYEET